MIEIDLETLVELVARAVVRIQSEQTPKPEPLGWQSADVAAKAIGVSRWTLSNKRELLRFNQDFKLMPGERTRYRYHVENCQKKLGKGVA